MQDLVDATTHAKKATVSQWCRVLGVSRSGLYAARKRRCRPKPVCTLSVQAKAAFEASGHKLRQQAPERGAEDARHGCGAPAGAHADAQQWSAGALAAQIRAHHGQSSRTARGDQCSGATVQSRGSQSRLGLRHHLCAHAQQLAVLGRGAGPVLAPGCGLVHGAEHACTAGVRSTSHGHNKLPATAGFTGAFGPWQPIRQPRAHGFIGTPRTGLQHEPKRQLLG